MKIRKISFKNATTGYAIEIGKLGIFISRMGFAINHRGGLFPPIRGRLDMYQMNKWAIREYLGVLILWLVAYFAYRWAGYDYLYSVVIAILPIIFGIFWVGQNLIEKLPWYHGMK